MTILQHWKSEHDAVSCEDAVLADLVQGLFAVADGAGTTLFSNLWARVLVEYFLQVPLLSNDPFEVEWWIRQAQERYRQRVPPLSTSFWSARQKMHEQGSHATLATLRVLQNESQSMQMGFLAIGDSCLLLKRADNEAIQTFPYTRPEEFDAAPVCFPSIRLQFDRAFHHCLSQKISLAPGDQAMLATDAVARWIMSAGKGSCADPRTAFQLVTEQTPQSWPAFVERQRSSRQMVDDDSTVLCLSCLAETEQDALAPGVINSHNPEIRVARKQAFELACEEQNKELLAIAYGDGTDLALENIFLSSEEREEAHRVADALQLVLAELRRTLNSSDMVPRMRRIWTQYASLLEDEACAANLRRTLISSGVISSTSSSSNSSATLPIQSLLARRKPATQEKQLSHVADEEDRFEDQQTIQFSLKSKNIQQMARSYTHLAPSCPFLTSAEQQQLVLAHRFKTAFDASSDEELFDVYTEILDLGYLSAFELNGHENERIAIIAHAREIQKREDDRRLAGTSPWSTAWVNRVTLVKHVYLFYKEQYIVFIGQTELLARTDLDNDQLVRRSIQEINDLYKQKVIDPDQELERDFERFQRAQQPNYQMLLDKYGLSEDEIKAIVAMFVRVQVLEDYLQQTVHQSLQDWLYQCRTRGVDNFFEERRTEQGRLEERHGL